MQELQPPEAVRLMDLVARPLPASPPPSALQAVVSADDTGFGAGSAMQHSNHAVQVRCALHQPRVRHLKNFSVMSSHQHQHSLGTQDIIDEVIRCAERGQLAETIQAARALKRELQPRTPVVSRPSVAKMLNDSGL